MRGNEHKLLRFGLSLITLLVVIIGIISTSNVVLADFSSSSEKILIAGDPAADDNFGRSVAVYGDTAVVGAPGKADDVGVAYVYVRSSSGTWSQQERLTAGDPAVPDFFGCSVAIYGDTAVVGAYMKASDTGVAYVFTRSGSTWTQQGRLTPSHAAAGDQFGYSVSIYGDTLVVGAPNKEILRKASAGAAYVFQRSGSIWSQQGNPLIACNSEAGDHFGSAVSIYHDTVVVGDGEKDIPGKANAGAAYVFIRSGSTWSQQGNPLTASDSTAGDAFGMAVSIYGDSVAVGAPKKFIENGAIYVFHRSGSTWSQQGNPLMSSYAGMTYQTYLGYSVSIYDNVVAAGAWGGEAAYVFTRSGSTWSQQGNPLTASGAATKGNFGVSVAIYADTMVVGADAKGHTGVAYVYRDVVPTITSVSPVSGITAGGTSVIITGTNFIEATSVHFGTTLATSFSLHNINTMIAVAPAGTGTVHVTVTTPNGTSTNSLADQFTYISPTQTSYTLAIGTAGNGTAAATVAGPYISGTVVNIHAIPASGWQFVNWTGDAVASSSSASTTIILNSNKTITGNFIQIQYTLTITISGNGTATGAGTYKSGAVVPIIATPSQGWRFTDWTVNFVGNPSMASTNITMNANKTIIANFSQMPTTYSTAGGKCGGLFPFSIMLGLLYPGLLVTFWYKRHNRPQV